MMPDVGQSFDTTLVAFAQYFTMDCIEIFMTKKHDSVEVETGIVNIEISLKHNYQLVTLSFSIKLIYAFGLAYSLFFCKLKQNKIMTVFICLLTIFLWNQEMSRIN